MIKFILISLVFVVLGILSSWNIFVVIILPIVVIPVVMIIQLLIFYVLKSLRIKKELCRLWSLSPAIIFFIWSIINISCFTKPAKIFQLALKADMPSSVSDLITYDYSWTDYYAEFYCKIAPEDLKMIIKKSKFRKVDESKKTFSFTRAKCLKINREPPWKGFVEYESNSKTNKSGLWDCYLYTNPQHNKIFVRYMAD